MLIGIHEIFKLSIWSWIKISKKRGPDTEPWGTHRPSPTKFFLRRLRLIRDTPYTPRLPSRSQFRNDRRESEKPRKIVTVCTANYAEEAVPRRIPIRQRQWLLLASSAGDEMSANAFTYKKWKRRIDATRNETIVRQEGVVSRQRPAFVFDDRGRQATDAGGGPTVLFICEVKKNKRWRKTPRGKQIHI